jgi:E3 ubiquitin-protein ligase HUWE1
MASNTRGKGPGKKSDTKSRALEDQLGETSRTVPDVIPSGSSWLNMSVDAALGCRARIFNVQKTGKSSLDKSASNVSVNSQASSFVCKHVIDALAALAKNFPASFTPEQVASCTETGTKDEPAVSSLNEAEFWNILVRLDGTYGGKKGKISAKSTSCTIPVKNSDFNASPIGYLMSLLSHPVIQKNANLMDSLLRLLSVISASLPDNADQTKALPSNEQTPTADAIRPTTPSNQSTASTGRAQTPESVTSSLVVETSPRGLEHETDSVDSGPTTGNLPQETGNEPMDVEVHSLTSTVSDTKTQSLDVAPTTNDVISDTVVMAPQLKLAVEVLTSGACSEDGLEDATTLLLQVMDL